MVQCPCSALQLFILALRLATKTAPVSLEYVGVIAVAKDQVVDGFDLKVTHQVKAVQLQNGLADER